MAVEPPARGLPLPTSHAPRHLEEIRETCLPVCPAQSVLFQPATRPVKWLPSHCHVMSGAAQKCRKCGVVVGEREGEWAGVVVLPCAGGGEKGSCWWWGMCLFSARCQRACWRRGQGMGNRLPVLFSAVRSYATREPTENARCARSFLFPGCLCAKNAAPKTRHGVRPSYARRRRIRQK